MIVSESVESKREKTSGHELIRKLPEVIANPPLEHTKSLISIPTYHGEWENGVLLRNLISVLSQNLRKGEATEVNYIFNMLGDLPAEVVDFHDNQPVWEKRKSDDEYWSKRKLADEAITFLKKVMEVQNNPVSAANMIDSVDDPLQKKALELAAKNSERVAVSVVNALDVPMADIGYHDRLSGYRTMGLDYAEARLGDDGVFLLFDTDAVPQDNNFAHDLNALFTANPNTKYALLRIGYQPTGTSKQMVETSPLVTFHGTRGYSTSEYTQTTQMAFRKEVFFELKEIMDLMNNYNFGSPHPGEEDRDTSMRLIGLYTDMVDGMLFQIDRTVGTMPVSLVEDRVDGLFDGAGRQGHLKNEPTNHDTQLVKMTELLKETQGKIQTYIDGLGDATLKAQLQVELAAAQKEFLHKQARNVRLNRMVAHDFIKLLELGEEGIAVGKMEWIDDDQVRKVIAKLPSGTALLTYLTRNKNLIGELTQADVDVMKYCLDPKTNRPTAMDSMSDFQKSMIDYIGYVDPKNEQAVPDELRSQLQPMLADLVAHSHVFSLQQVSKEFYRESGVEQFIIDGDLEKKHEIHNYQAVQDKRDKSWNVAAAAPIAVQTNWEKQNPLRKVLAAVSPRFASFLKRASKK